MSWVAPALASRRQIIAFNVPQSVGARPKSIETGPLGATISYGALCHDRLLTFCASSHRDCCGIVT